MTVAELRLALDAMEQSWSDDDLELLGMLDKIAELSRKLLAVEPQRKEES